MLGLFFALGGIVNVAKQKRGPAGRLRPYKAPNLILQNREYQVELVTKLKRGPASSPRPYKPPNLILQNREYQVELVTWLKRGPASRLRPYKPPNLNIPESGTLRLGGLYSGV